MTAKKKDQIRALLKSIETGDTDAVAVVNEARYVQHNPHTHEGSEGLAELFGRLEKLGLYVDGQNFVEHNPYRADGF
ncbi:MAG: putative SnoaL-like aldol condensation-catalyzing enzyme [Acidimicrobiales bacterium]